MIGSPDELSDTPIYSDEEDQLRRGGIGRIAAPGATTGLPPVNARGLGPVTPAASPAPGSTEDLEARGSASRIAPLPIAKPSALEQRTTADQAKLTDLQAKGSGIAQIKNPLGRNSLRVLETIGNVIAPRTTSMIPGTEGHHNRLIAQQEGKIGEDEAEQRSADTSAKSAADTEEAQARAEALRHPPGQIKEEQLLYDKAGNAIGYRDEKGIYHDADDPTLPAGVKAVLAAAQPKPEKTTPAHVTYDGGIPVSVVSAKGETFDVNDPKLPDALKPLVQSALKAHGQHVKEDADKQAQAAANANSHQNKAEDFQKQEKGREHLQKAEDGYREASEKADTLRGVVQAAQSGNMVAGSLQPLLAVLGVTTMEGVKRINNTELENVQGAGSLWDKIKGKVGKLAEGQPMDAALQGDITKLADLLQQSAYKKYQDNHKAITKRYSLSDEEPIPGPTSADTNAAPKDYGPAPEGKPEGSTGVLPDGTKIVIKGGRIVAQ